MTLISEASRVELFRILQEKVPEIPLLGWRMREALAEHWFRIYYLPNGKRHPTNNSERKEALSRINAVSHELIGSKSKKVWIISPVEEASRYSKIFLDKCGNWTFLKRINEESEDSSYSIYGMTFSEYKKIPQKIFKFISYDKIMASIVISEDGNMLGPYDGGMDVFVENQNDLSNLKSRFKYWLSDRQDGL